MAYTFVDAKGLAKHIKELQEQLTHFLHLQSFLGGSHGKKRGRPAKIQGHESTGKPVAKRGRKTKTKRGETSGSILKFLSTKGKDGAHVKDIAVAVGTKPANVTAFAYSSKGKQTVKKVKPGTFALK